MAGIPIFREEDVRHFEREVSKANVMYAIAILACAFLVAVVVLDALGVW